MEIQIPLVIFTSFLAWSAGLFSTQCIMALKKKGAEVQLPALVVSFVVLVVGGIAVLFHLRHPFNIFNGFGHITSGITQELIAIALLVVVMVLFFLMMRRSGDNTVPAGLAIAGLVVVVILVIAMGHSYMLASKPAWDSILQLLSLLGAACVLGPASFALIAALKNVEVPELGLFNLVGSIVNAVLTVGFLVSMQVSTSSLQSFAYYFDPTHPNYSLKSGATYSVLNGDALAPFIFVVLGVVVAIIGAVLGKKQGNWKVWGSVIVVAGLVSALALRTLMYVMGVSIFMLY
jgi:anaerobic dimethyl sulfoxide reductase subunit C (anchor subunit)